MLQQIQRSVFAKKKKSVNVNKSMLNIDIYKIKSVKNVILISYEWRSKYETKSGIYMCSQFL